MTDSWSKALGLDTHLIRRRRGVPQTSSGGLGCGLECDGRFRVQALGKLLRSNSSGLRASRVRRRIESKMLGRFALSVGTHKSLAHLRLLGLRAHH